MRNAVFIFSILAFALFSCDSRKEAVKEEVGKVPAKTASSVKAEVAATKPATAENLAKFDFEETSFDFGQINQGDVVKHTFKFTNAGAAPLIISDIRTTCGCTTPEYTKEPIAPGESGEILVQFNSRGKSGTQKKAVTIYANVEGGSSVINISSQVKVDQPIDGPYKKEKDKSLSQL